MVNLTAVEAQQRAASVRVDSYEVRLDLDSGDKTFESTSSISFESVTGAPTFVEVFAEAVHRIELNGEALSPDLVHGHRIPLARVRATTTSSSRRPWPTRTTGRACIGPSTPRTGGSTSTPCRSSTPRRAGLPASTSRT